VLVAGAMVAGPLARGETGLSRVKHGSTN